jgi:peptidyl-prolyl cis-trans isomerase D
MATLEKIRNRAGWLISLVLGLALLAFILGDFLKKSTYGGGGDDTIAEILGQEIKYRDYMHKLNQLTENYKINTGKTGLTENESEMLRKQAWDDIVSDVVMGKEFDELGLKVSSDELYDMVAGQNISPQIISISQPGK